MVIVHGSLRYLNIALYVLIRVVSYTMDSQSVAANNRAFDDFKGVSGTFCHFCI